MTNIFSNNYGDKYDKFSNKYDGKWFIIELAGHLVLCNPGENPFECARVHIWQRNWLTIILNNLHFVLYEILYQICICIRFILIWLQDWLTIIFYNLQPIELLNSILYSNICITKRCNNKCTN